jgi:type I restriction enzyme S subunit
MATNGWAQVPLGEVCENFDRVRVPLSSRERELRRGPVPYYGAAGIIDWVNDSLLDGKYLLVGEDGSVETESGRPVLQLTSGRFWVNNHAHVLRGRTEEETRFLYYALSTVGIHEYLSGSVQPKLTQENLNRIEVPYPSEGERLSIARFLGSLDDKIALNRRMNRTLEQIAQALFKSWFVDFDPVCAKAEGRWKKGESLPGMPADMWDLWPSEFEESEIGEIPKGWGVVSVSSAVEVNPERRLSKGQVAPYVEMSQLQTASARVAGWVDRPFASGSRFQNGDVLVARITPCLENGKTAYVDFLNGRSIAWGSTEFLVLSSKSPLAKEWAYCLARTEEFRLHLIQNMSGTSGRQRAPAECLDSFFISAPSSEIAERFGQAVRPGFIKMRANDAESSTLASTRDLLLPKLLSGEIRVRLDGGQ